MMDAMSRPLRVAYTLEQCWHDVPGGTARASIEVARRLAERDDVELVGVAGRHRRPARAGYEPSVAVRRLPLARPLLYDAWNRWSWPRVERVTGPIDVCHSTTAIPAATDAPHVVTVHDIAFVHAPERFTSRGVRVMNAGLERCRSADLVLVPSGATRDDLVVHGFDGDRVRIVPWGVEPSTVSDADVDRVRAAYALPRRFALFVGTLEPRKNLTGLVAALAHTAEPLPLVVAGPDGWGETAIPPEADVRALGFVPADDLGALYAAASVVAYPSLEEGYGMPVVEAMSHGTPVVTSRGTATEEVAAGAAVLVDPSDPTSIAAGIDRATAERERWARAGRRRAGELSWDATVEATVAAYRSVARRDAGR